MLVRELRGSKEVVEEKEGVIRVKDEELEKGLKERKERSTRRSFGSIRQRSWSSSMIRAVGGGDGACTPAGGAAKRELEELSEKKEKAVAMVDKLSDEILKLQKDEEQILLKEVKISRAKKKQAEMEMDRWRSLCESRSKKSLRALLLMEAGSSIANNSETSVAETESFDHCSSCQVNAKIGCVDAIVLEQRHYAEIEAFTEQMRLKDLKLSDGSCSVWSLKQSS